MHFCFSPVSFFSCGELKLRCPNVVRLSRLYSARRLFVFFLFRRSFFFQLLCECFISFFPSCDIRVRNEMLIFPIFLFLPFLHDLTQQCKHRFRMHLNISLAIFLHLYASATMILLVFIFAFYMTRMSCWTTSTLSFSLVFSLLGSATCKCLMS